MRLGQNMAAKVVHVLETKNARTRVQRRVTTIRVRVSPIRIESVQRI